MAEFLVAVGIDSMSLNSDTVAKTTRQVLQVEQQPHVEQQPAAR